MKAVILLGAPGSGKGTTAEKVRDRAGCIHVSTGDMLREAVKNGTRVGREAESYMKKGELVPDEVMIRLVEDRIDAGSPDDVYLFDGFPRTVAQAGLLEESLVGHGGELMKVIFLDAPREVLISRLTGRRTCRSCGAVYHIVNIPPRQEGECDTCGGELYQRPDDCEDTIVNRLEIFNRQTESLIERYEAKGLLVRVDSSQPADGLALDVMAVLKGGEEESVGSAS